MASKNSIDFSIIGIAGALAEKGLQVPLYQRSYAWEQKHVDDLFTDIGTAITEKRDEYFLGSIVLLEEDGILQVVDGQQRLATVAILIAAIRDYFKENGDDDRAADLEREYLISKDRRTQELHANLRLNSVDHDFFLKTVLQYGTPSKRRKTKPSHESHRKIKKCAEQARKYIKKLSGITKDPFQYLIDWLDFLDKQAKIIRVQVPDGTNAFTIFETLNDRGLDLAISDLLKNFLFNKSGNRIAEAQESWSSMIGSLSAVDAEKHVVAYIRHVWSAQHGLTRERELFQNIKEKIVSKQAAIDFCHILGESSKLYAAILNPNHDTWKKYGETTKRHMVTLNLLRMTQVRPLILAVLANFTPSDISKTMKMLVSLAVRFYILGKLGSGDLENFYANKARDISNKKIPNFSKLKSESKKDVPTNSQFETAFSTATVGKNYLSRYYLLALENMRISKENSELIPNDNPDVVNLEHVLPLTLSDEWDVEDHFHETHVNRLGNLTLLLSSENSLVGNESFNTKKDVYRKSKLSITKDIAKSAKWEAAEIDSRQRDLAKLAVKAWSV